MSPPIPPNIVVAEERKRPRLLGLIFCDFASTTKDDKPNLLGVFDSIVVDRERRITPPFVVYIRVAELADTFVTTVFNPDEVPVVQFRSVIAPVDSTSPSLPRQAQTLLPIQISDIRKEGVYWFDVSYQGNSIGGAGLPIHYKKEGDQTSGTQTYV